MSFLPSFHPPALLTGVPDGYDALLLAELAQTTKKVVYIARDENRALRLKNQLSFFDPSRPVLFFPGWDCLPYDRVSPHPDIIAQRVDTLTTLTTHQDSFLLITTLPAFLQKVPPFEIFQGKAWHLKSGQTVDYNGLLSFLTHTGYTRREIVQEWGEFAIRGSLIDLFPPGYNSPLRLDFFGKTLETIRTFDPLHQTTIATVDTLSLKPMSEIQLTPESISLFRKKYRDHFGVPSPKDPLYTATSEMRPSVGYEHWLPLFYETLVPFASYIEGALYCLDEYLEDVRTTFIDQI